MTAIEVALHGLVDYAGLYPPASLDMASAVRNYLAYRRHPHSSVLGRFIIDIARLDELRQAAGDAFDSLRLSVIVQAASDPSLLARSLEDGFRIESVEMKCDEPLTIARISEKFPAELEQYFEIPVRSICTGAIDALCSIGHRAKLRMGGVAAEAFPPSNHVIDALRLLADRQVSFKATAGLHHPVRSLHPLTYAADSPSSTMHGFVNLLFAAATIWFGGLPAEAEAILEEQDPGAFHITRESISVHGRQWNADQLRQVRQFFISFGSCSFAEPIHDLEALGWI